MSYLPFRDSHDLVGLPADTYARLEPLAERIEESSARGNHGDQCACDDPDCEILARYLNGWAHPSTEEVLGWLVAKGMLRLPPPTPAPGRVKRNGVWAPGDIVRWSNATGWFLARLDVELNPRQGERPAKWEATCTANGTFYEQTQVGRCMRLSEADFAHEPDLATPSSVTAGGTG